MNVAVDPAYLSHLIHLPVIRATVLLVRVISALLQGALSSLLVRSPLDRLIVDDHSNSFYPNRAYRFYY
jgi:hypothetical protein